MRSADSLRRSLSGRYTYLARGFVSTGMLAALWKSRRAAVRLVPVLGLIGSAHPPGECVSVETGSLRSLTGLSPRRLAQCAGIIDGLTEIKPDGKVATSFRLFPGVVADDREPGYRFPGNIVASGTWAALRDVECVLLLAVGAITTNLHYPGRSAEEWCGDWLDELEEQYEGTDYEVHRDGKSYHYPFVKRYAITSLAQLSRLTSLSRPQVSATLADLATRLDGELLEYRSSREGLQIHLPWELNWLTEYGRLGHVRSGESNDGRRDSPRSCSVFGRCYDARATQ